MVMDQEQDHLAAVEAGNANPSAAGSKDQIRNALSLCPDQGEDVLSTVCLNSKSSFAQFCIVALCTHVSVLYCMVQPVAVPSVTQFLNCTDHRINAMVCMELL